MDIKIYHRLVRVFMRIKKLLIVAMSVAFITTMANAQWGEMHIIYWNNPPGNTVIGYYNPSYCDAESLLYFDDCLRTVPDGQIYTTHFDSTLYGERVWSDPILVPAPIFYEGNFASATPCINTTNDTLLFASNRPGTLGGMDIWISYKENGEWQEPINLGDSINTEGDEEKPYWAKNSQILYYERKIVSTSARNIYSSTLLNGVWQEGQILPGIINYGDINIGTFFDEQENALYYTNQCSDNLVDRLCKSYLVNGEWQEPDTLPGTVNGFYYSNYCDRVTTEDAWLSADKETIFYDKWVWEWSFCFDWFSFLFYSEATVGIDEENEEPLPEQIDFEIYPNPSNAGFMLSIPAGIGCSEINIYNLNGQVVKTIAVSNGNNSVYWDGSSNSGDVVVSGVYFAVLSSEAQVFSKKMVLLK